MYFGTSGLSLGSTFKVTTDGKVTATYGKIGDFNLNSALYSGTTSMTSNIPGIYLGTDGIRQYNNANSYINIANGSLTCVGGSIIGSSFVANGSITKYAKDYSNSDEERMKQIYLGNIKGNPQDLEKYDLDGDGRITLLDLANVKRLLEGIEDSITFDTSLQINPMNNGNILQTEGVIIKRLGINANTVTSETAQSKEYYVWTDDINGYKNGVSGSFKSQDGKSVTVNNGIITSIMS